MTAAAPGKSFFDTNILVYLFAPDAPEKRSRAREILERAAIDAELVVSVQVPSGVLRHGAAGSRPHGSRGSVVAGISARGLEGLVLGCPGRRSRAALRAAPRLYTEDLQDGWQIDGRLRVVNPFA